ncbi:DNA-methyltransferase [Hyalangium rubrum]|uniref:Methyltransferase n=1 Tax=Hyalangium rubrum TaxID=3103134 RepID=A0ABU5HAQ4_9BACT|nr:site-specific DNA-methyltransferase [Hyalangium sp. s54d21]MDY7230555.1 site-specific DNA-methyltransferase [Hyalangium sp. s54d21]
MSAEATALKIVDRSLSESLFAKGDAYRLYQGNSLELMNKFPEQQFDLIFADPPYFLSNGGFTCKSGKRASVQKGAWDVSRGVEEDHAFTTEWLKACQRLLKPTGTLWVSGTQHVIFSVGFAMQKLGFKLLNTVTWYKPNASPNLSCRYFTHSTELLIWASPKPAKTLQHTFNYARMKAENGGKQMRDVWNLPRTGEEELTADGSGRMWTQIAPRREEKAFGSHPTQKPVALLERIIEASTPEDATVLDPFNGSGTTGVAALKLGRRYTGIDLDAKYLDLTKKRLDAVKR